MSDLQPDHSDAQVTPPQMPMGQTSEQAAQPDAAVEVHGPPAALGGRSVPWTRWGAAWVGICAAALASVALIVFMAQNTRPVEVSFLWLHGTLPLALALLIAAVGAVLVAMIVGVARITQLRKLAHRRGSRPAPDPETPPG